LPDVSVSVVDGAGLSAVSLSCLLFLLIVSLYMILENTPSPDARPSNIEQFRK